MPRTHLLDRIRDRLHPVDDAGSDTLQRTLMLNAVLAQREARRFRDLLGKKLKLVEIRANERGRRVTLLGERIFVLGPHRHMRVAWDTRPPGGDIAWETMGELWEADTLGFWEYTCRQPDHHWRELELVDGRDVWSATWEDLEDIRRQLSDDRLFDDLVSRLGWAALFTANPAINCILGFERIALALDLEVVEHPPGVDIYGGAGLLRLGKNRSDSLYLPLPHAEVELWQGWAPQGDQQVRVGFGSIFGLSVLWRQDPGWSEKATAGASCKLLRLKLQKLRSRLRPSHNGLTGQFFEYLSEVGLAAQHTDQTLQALRGIASLADAPWQTLFPCLQAWRGLLWRMGAPPPSPVGEREGIGAILSGEVVDYVFESGATELEQKVFGTMLSPCSVHGKGQVFGADGLAGESVVSRHYRVRVPTKLVFIHKESMEPLWRRYPRPVVHPELRELRRSLYLACLPESVKKDIASVWESGKLRSAQTAELRTQLIYVDPLGQDRARRELPALLERLARAIQDEFQEVGVVVHLRRQQGVAAAPSPAAPIPGCFPTIERFIDDTPEAIRDALVEIIDELRKDERWMHLAYLWVRTDADLKSSKDLPFMVSRVVYLNTTYDDVGEPGVRVPWPELSPGHAPYVYTTILPSDLTKATGARYPPCTTRLLLAEGTEKKGVHTSRQMARWARAVTNRRVGVALSGGEAWGAAHYALLDTLEDAGIPIDVVSGASAGALFGAYYCKGGIDLVRERFMSGLSPLRWQVLNTVAVATTAPVRSLVTRELDDVHLETLELPLIPVGTSVDLSAPSSFLWGPIAREVWKSGSLVPFVPPMIVDGQTWVDGAFSDNLPVDALELDGVRFIISCNVMAAPRPRPPRGRRLGPVSDFLGTLNPLVRLDATLRGAFTLAYSAGSRSALSGVCSFQTDWTEAGIFDILNVGTIASQARASPEMWDLLHAIQQRWAMLKSPRCDQEAPNPGAPRDASCDKG